MTIESNQIEKSANQKIVPVHLLSGFLGSGKTTLLNRAIDYYKASDVKAAIIMNELGDVNLEGQLVGEDVPMAEMLGGCICCTIRGDLGMELKALLDEHQPDVILIESTGAANPMEMMDGITETSMYAHVELRSVVTVVDGPQLLERSRKGGRTFKLMQDQIRCATDLIVNKADRLNPEELIEVQQLVRELNAYAPLTVTIRCMTDMSFFDVDSNHQLRQQALPAHSGHVCGANCSHDHHEGEHHTHATHEHVLSLTHYWSGPVDSHAFEAFMAKLPDNIYRAKGVITFSDMKGRFLFQYAYRELDCFRITPQGEVHDVAVFIGEHFSKEELKAGLEQLQLEISSN